MTIRKVRISDAAAIAAIYNEYIVGTTISFEQRPLTTDEMSERISAISSSYPYFVCEDAGNVVGYCYAHAWKERAAYKHTYETTIYISPAHHGKGIGRLLMERLIETCHNAGCHSLIACITGDNQPSIRFHEQLGFRRASLFHQVGRKFGRWLDVVDYELLLS